MVGGRGATAVPEVGDGIEVGEVGRGGSSVGEVGAEGMSSGTDDANDSTSTCSSLSKRTSSNPAPVAAGDRGSPSSEGDDIPAAAAADCEADSLGLTGGEEDVDDAPVRASAASSASSKASTSACNARGRGRMREIDVGVVG